MKAVPLLALIVQCEVARMGFKSRFRRESIETLASVAEVHIKPINSPSDYHRDPDRARKSMSAPEVQALAAALKLPALFEVVLKTYEVVRHGRADTCLRPLPSAVLKNRCCKARGPGPIQHLRQLRESDPTALWRSDSHRHPSSCPQEPRTSRRRHGRNDQQGISLAPPNRIASQPRYCRMPAPCRART